MKACRTCETSRRNLELFHCLSSFYSNNDRFSVQFPDSKHEGNNREMKAEIFVQKTSNKTSLNEAKCVDQFSVELQLLTVQLRDVLWQNSLSKHVSLFLILWPEICPPCFKQSHGNDPCRSDGRHTFITLLNLLFDLNCVILISNNPEWDSALCGELFSHENCSNTIFKDILVPLLVL